MPPETSCHTSAVYDFELAVARLEWVRASSCLHLAAQDAAVRWHVAACDEALAALPSDAASSGDMR